MQLTIDVPMLIERAKQVSGVSLKEMAAEMHISQARITEWKKGKYKPDASEIAYFADKADLPILPTVAEIESQIHPMFAAVWKKALLSAAKSLVSLTKRRLRARGQRLADVAHILGDSGLARAR